MKDRNLDNTDNWGTPPTFLQSLISEFNFNFDPCPLNHDLKKFDGLKIEWKERNFINPPYSQKLKERFVIKAIKESKKGKLCVMLLPVSTSTKLFHDYILPNKPEIRFVKSRLSFYGINTKFQNVNFHQVDPNIDTKQTIKWNTGKTKSDGDPLIVDIPKYVKNSGMHDSMVVIFDGRKKLFSYFRK